MYLLEVYFRDAIDMLPLDRRQRLEELAAKLNFDITPEFIKYLAIATTHPSMHVNNEISIDYERLEFLGDSVLGFIIADLLFQNELPIPVGTRGI